MGPRVALVLVSHDGAQWLPTILDAIDAQTLAPHQRIAVDTGSKDASVQLLGARFDQVIVESGRTSFSAAVNTAVQQTDAEWIWLLHDDSTPAPTALAELLRGANDFPHADIFGPKLREWPSLRRLLEVGVTITGTGRRYTGLERGETDQGQHDDVTEVLAVNTAGMLVRRQTLIDLGGLDERLPLFGNDIDLGWRAANSGVVTMVIPDAVVFHLQAAHAGIRRTPLTGRHTHFAERRAALYTIAVNSPRWTLPFKMLRLAVGTLLRMVGFFIVRSPGEAFDELAALVDVIAHPGEIIRARRSRTVTSSARGLLAPWWLPYRIGLDFVSDVGEAVSNQAADVAERRRIAAAEADPASFAARAEAQRQALIDDEDAMLSDSGWLARINPVLIVLGLVVLVGLIAARDSFGLVVAPGLSPAPSTDPGWWELHFQSWHPIGEGSGLPAPGYVLVLAILGAVLGSQGTVTAIMVLSFPIGLWGAWRLMRVLGRLSSPQGAPRWLMAWGAVTWALLPVVTHAWGQGRIGVVVSGAILGWLVTTSLGFADPDADRRWRAAWRTGLLLAIATAFTPLVWPIAVLIGAGLIATAWLVLPGLRGNRSALAPPLVALGIPLLLLSPWWLPLLTHGVPGGLLLDAGRIPGQTDVLGPWWFASVVAGMAALALIPRSTRIPVLACWAIATVSAVTTGVASLIQISVRGGHTPVGAAVGVQLSLGALLIGCLLGAQGALAARKPDWWRAPAVALCALATAAPLLGMTTWLFGANSLDHHDDTVVPAYMREQAEATRSDGILILQGSVESGLSYAIERGDGVTLGEDEVRALTPVDRGLEADIQTLVTNPTPQVVDRLGRVGIRYILMPAPADPAVSQAIDSSGAVTRTSAVDRVTPAWQLGSEPLLDPDGRDWLRTVLLTVQMISIVVVLVLCLPTIRQGRSRSGRAGRRAHRPEAGEA